MDKDRRNSARKEAKNSSISLRPLDPQVWFRFWNSAEYSMRDISMVGAGVVSNERIPIGTPLSIDLRLSKDISTIRVFGKVEWITEDAGMYRTGVSFSWWKDDQDKQLVNEYLGKLLNIN
ncbi:MAG: PilZ domain-containing protein [Candidatus Omnitrophota bacterium]